MLYVQKQRKNNKIVKSNDTRTDDVNVNKDNNENIVQELNTLTRVVKTRVNGKEAMVAHVGKFYVLND